MPDVSLSGISFTIKGNADAASDSVEKLTTRLEWLKDTMKSTGNVKSLVSNLKSINQALEGLSKSNSVGASKAISNIAKAIEGFKSVGDVSKNLASFARSMNKLAENKDDRLSSLAVWLARIAEIDFSNLEKAGQGIREISDAAKKLSSGKASGAATQASQSVFSIMKKDLSSVLPLIKKFSSYVRKGAGGILGYPFKSAYKGIAGYAKGLAGVVGGFKRIVGYRVIRTIIKEITQAFSEGINNLYGWSRLVGGEFARSMDTIATSMRYFKNSIAAAVAPIINALAPAIDFLVDKIVTLINVLNQLFAKLTGATYWTRAKKKATEYGDAVGGAGAAAKDAIKYLAPFDELNVLPDQKDSGGGGGSGEDYSDMFEDVTEFNEAIANFADAIKEKVQAGDWQGLGELLGNKVNDLVDMIDFAGIGAKVGTYINAWFTTKYWTLQTINFQNIGAKIAEFLNNALEQINFDTIGRTITQKFTILGDFIIVAVENINWTLVGKSIGDFIRGAFDQMTEWLTGINWEEFGTHVAQNLINMFKGMNVSTVAESIKNFLKAAFEAAKGLISGMSVEFPILDVVFDWSGLTAENIAQKVVAGITMLTGAGVGFMIAGVPGALVGSIVGLTIGLVIDSVYFDNNGTLDTNEIIASLKYAISALTGGVIGFLAGGVPGAVIGATLSLALTIAIDSIKFKKEDGLLSGESGRTGIDYFIVDVIGLPSDEDWKQYGRNIWNWLKEGIADIKTELYNIFIKPIVDAFDEFAENHPVIAGILGLDNGLHDIGGLGNQAGESMWNIDATVDVTDVKDSIPTEKKTLKDFWADIKDKYNNIKDKLLGGFTADVNEQEDSVPKNNKILRDEVAQFGSVDGTKLSAGQRIVNGIKAIFGSTDGGANLTTSQKKVPAIANFTGIGKAFSSASTYKGNGTQPLLSSVANLTGMTKNFSTGTTYKGNHTQPLLSSIANLTGMTKNFSAGTTYKGNHTQPLLGSIANLAGYTKNFSAGTTYKGNHTQPLLGSIANLGGYVKSFSAGTTYNGNGTQPFLSSVSNLVSYIRDFRSGTNNNDGKTPIIGSLANLFTWENNLRNPWTYALALLNLWENAIDYYNNEPQVDTKGKITTAYDGIPDWAIPSVKCYGEIISASGADAVAGSWATGGALYGNQWHEIPQYAAGTRKAHGSLFIAGEAGPEVVGHIGGRTEVLNRSQLAATMYAAVSSAMAGLRFNVSGMNAATASEDSGYDEETLYRAMLRALNDSDVFPDEIDLDGDAVYRKMVQRNRLNTRMTGVNAMATA